MQLFLVKPDMMYFEAYRDMMEEWRSSGTQIAPWFFNIPTPTLEDFAAYVRHLDDTEVGRVDPGYSASTSYFVVDEAGTLVGGGSLRHYLTVEGLRGWGHCGYGVRPSQRRKGYGTQILHLLLDEARKKHILQVLMGAHESNTGSRRVIEKCGGVYAGTVAIPGEEEPACQYWIDNRPKD